MTGLATTVANVVDGKKYFVSTIKLYGGSEYYQSAVFRKLFGPFANFSKPKSFFVGNDEVYLHDRVSKIVRNIDPAGWDDEEWIISSEGDQAHAEFNAIVARYFGDAR